MGNKARAKNGSYIGCKHLQRAGAGNLGTIIVCGCAESERFGNTFWDCGCSGCEKYELRKEKESVDNMIEHPDHYCAGRKYEPAKVIRDWGCGFFDGNAIKYIARAGRKPGSSRKEDLQKAIQYLKLEIEAIESEES